MYVIPSSRTGECGAGGETISRGSKYLHEYKGNMSYVRTTSSGQKRTKVDLGKIFGCLLERFRARCLDRYHAAFRRPGRLLGTALVANREGNERADSLTIRLKTGFREGHETRTCRLVLFGKREKEGMARADVCDQLMWPSLEGSFKGDERGAIMHLGREPQKSKAVVSKGHSLYVKLP